MAIKAYDFRTIYGKTISDKVYRTDSPEKIVLNHVECIFENCVFEGTCINGVDFVRCSFKHCMFKKCDFLFVEFRDCDLGDVDFTGNNFRRSSISGGVYPKLESRVPEKGHGFYGWKKAHFKVLRGRWVICLVKLWIPKDAERLSSIENKCRASKAKVVGLYLGDRTIVDNGIKPTAISCFKPENSSPLAYTLGEYVTPDSYDPDRFHTCSHGIHFFRTRKEAEEYY